MSQVETRPRTPEEIAELRSASFIPIEIPEYELTNRTFSLAMDTGMYLAETLRAQYPRLEWKQPLGGKRLADYGQPVLAGFGPVLLNPVRVLVTLAYAIADQEQDGHRLLALYDYWAKQAASDSRH